MMTFFTIPRSFEGEFDKLQRKALASWRDAAPGSETILYFHLPTNEHGTPLVNAAFERAEEQAAFDWLCECSADVSIESDLRPVLDALEGIARPFVIGQRHDRDKEGRLSLHAPYGVDYFLYRRSTIGEIPPFAVGRTAYDNWLVWAAIERWDMTTIDATDAIKAVHDDHGRPVYGTREKMLQSDERAENIRLAQATGNTRWHGVHDAPYVLRGGEVVAR